MTDRTSRRLEAAAGSVVVTALAGLAVWFVAPWLGYPVPIPDLRGADPGPTSAAWRKALPRIKRADERAARAADARVAEVAAFFDGRLDGADGFASDALSWSGKWALLTSPFRAGDAHGEFLSDAFSRNVFDADDLQAVLEKAVAGYLADLDASEGALLVELRADLADADLPRGAAEHLRADEAFRREVRRLSAEVAPSLAWDLGTTAGKEAVVFVAADALATAIVSKVAAGAAAEAGLSAGILGSGVASGAATLGVGIALSFAIDAALSQAMRACGHDPEGALAREVRKSVRQTRDRVIGGADGALSTHRRLVRMAESDGEECVREACRRAAAKVGSGGRLGLREELRRLHEGRSRARSEALRKLLTGGAR